MFSGIITNKAEITDMRKIAEGVEITLKTNNSIGEVLTGDSIALNGACLTATDIKKEGSEVIFSCSISQETLDKTTADTWKIGTFLHCEGSLRFGDRVGGHLMNGHIDQTIKVTDITKQGDFTIFKFDLPAKLKPFICIKGSVAIDGVSLTVNDIDDIDGNGFFITVIPHTMQVTEFSKLKANALVNIEVDIMARYLEKQTQKTA